jgi:preprotein translocase subunit YajC
MQSREKEREKKEINKTSKSIKAGGQVVTVRFSDVDI